MTLPHFMTLLSHAQELLARRTAVRFARASLLGGLLLAVSLLAPEFAVAEEEVPTWLKPFAWKNPQTNQYRQLEQEEVSPWLKPIQYRSDTRVPLREDEYTANEPTFSTVKQPFSWKNPEDKTNDESFRDLTDDEQIDFEKENYVWIRPFYWSNRDTPLEDATWEPYYANAKESSNKSRWLAPFQWKNPPAGRRKSTSQQLAQGGDQLWRLPPVGETQTVAYLMQAGVLPPGPSGDASVADDSVGSEEIASREQLDELIEGEIPENLEELQTPSGELVGDGQGAIAEAEALGSEPEDNFSLQFLRADTVLLSPGEMQFDYGFTYQLLDIDIPVVNSSSFVELARFRQRELLTPLEVRYGFTRKLQLFANAPFGWSNVELNWSEAENFENDGGFGDLTFGGSFLVRQGNHCCSDIIWTNACTAPTGLDPFAPITGIPNAPSLGNGTWSLSSNLLFIRTYDPLVVFYGFGTRQHFDRDVNGQRFEAGQEYNYQMGVGFAVNSKVTFSTRFNGAYVTESRFDGNRILGSIQEPMVVQFALTIAQCKGLVEPFIDFGLTDESIESRFGVIWTRF